MTNICRLGPDGKYAGNINRKYVVLANILYSTVACTCNVGCNVSLLSVLESIIFAFRLLHMSFINQMAPKNMCWLLEKISRSQLAPSFFAQF